MLGINAKVDDVKREIIKVINEAQMPVCLIDYIMTEVLNDVRMKRMGAVQKEREAYQKEQAPEPTPAPEEKKVCVNLPTPENPMPKEGE